MRFPLTQKTFRKFMEENPDAEFNMDGPRTCALAQAVRRMTAYDCAAIYTTYWFPKTSSDGSMDLSTMQSLPAWAEKVSKLRGPRGTLMPAAAILKLMDA